MHSAKTSKVEMWVEGTLIGIDVKLNLQETDYGNFLGEEVRCFWRRSV